MTFTIPNPFEKEFNLLEQGYEYIAGVDEVGRGCIAGPVVAGAVLFNPQTVHNQPWIEDIKDSKRLTPFKRELLFDLINVHALSVAIASVDHMRIDKINILNASLEAMAQAVNKLKPQAEFVLIDGNQKAPITLPQETIIKGDQKITSIAAASIIAKVYRDRWMTAQAQTFPAYGFDKHKGYGTKAHKQAIVDHGFCTLHRRSFNVGLP